MAQIIPPPGQIFATPQGDGPGVNTTTTSGGTPTTTTGGPTGLDPSLQAIINLITGGIDLGTANQRQIAGQTAANIADPWASQRGPYQTALNTWMQQPGNSPMAALAPMLNLIKNPSSLLTTPGYQFGMSQAMDAVNRGAGSSGLLNSGNRLLALQNQGQAYAGSWFDRMFGADATAAGLGLKAQGQGFDQLAQLAGVNAGSPSAAAQAYLTGAVGKDKALTSGVTGIATGAAALLPQILKALGIGGGGPGTDIGTGTDVPSIDDIINQVTGGGSSVDTSGFWNQGPFGPDPTGISTGDQNIINDILGQGGGGQDTSSIVNSIMGNVGGGFGGFGLGN
jgi:hypothetical protein